MAKGDTTVFDFGEFQSEVASRRNPDASVSFLTTIPGFDGLEFVVGYTFSEKGSIARCAAP